MALLLSEPSAFVLRSYWVNFKGLYGVIAAWTMKVGMALLLSDLLRFVWRYYCVKSKGLYGVITK